MFKNILPFIRSIGFYLVYPITAASIGVLGILCVKNKPLKQRYNFITQWNKFIIKFTTLCCGIKYELRGKENILDGAFVVMSKHQSQWETFYFQVLFNPLITVLKSELLKVPGFGWGLALLDPIAIDRSSPKQALKYINSEGQKRLAEGLPVLIFPEGTRIAYGETGKYSRGGANLAISANVPVIPVAHNAGKYWPSGKFIKYPGTIIVSVGKPIDTAGKTSKEITDQVQQWIESEIERFPD